jgi:hypothetical protein
MVARCEKVVLHQGLRFNVLVIVLSAGSRILPPGTKGEARNGALRSGVRSLEWREAKFVAS